MREWILCTVRNVGRSSPTSPTVSKVLFVCNIDAMVLCCMYCGDSVTGCVLGSLYKAMAAKFVTGFNCTAGRASPMTAIQTRLICHTDCLYSNAQNTSVHTSEWP